MYIFTFFEILFTSADSAPPPNKYKRESERERKGRMYVHQEGTAADRMEIVLMVFFLHIQVGICIISSSNS